MKMLYSATILTVIFIGSVSCEYNFTYAMAARCKEHICREGYRYVTFYAIDKGAYKSKNTTSAGLVLEMHIAILAPKDGHIILSTLPDPKPTDPVYEIVIGGGNNSFSELRRMRQRYAKSSQLTRNILSPIEYRAFWIKMGNDGVLEIGEEGSDIAKLSYMDPDPIPINYFSFAGWYGVEAKFLYDCPLPGDMAEQLPNSKIVEEPPLPPTMRLRKWILRQTLGSPPPVENSSRVLVTMWTTQVLATQFDVIESQIEVNIFVTMGWQDPRLYWNATAYEGHAGIIFENSELWTPQLTVSNGIGLNVLDPGGKAPIYVTNEGYIVHTFATRFEAWCNAGIGILRWPKDDHVCTLKIGPIGSSNQFVLAVKSIDEDESNKNASFASYSNPLGTLPETSEWEVTSMSQHTEWYSSSPGVKISEEIKGVNVDPEGVYATKLMITLYIRRRNTSMSIMVYTPLFALMFFSLASLWIPNSNTTLKTWSSLVLIPIGCSLLYTIEDFVPFISDELPDVAYFYTCMIYTSLIYWILHVLRDHYLSRKFINSSPAISVMSWSPLRTAFGLPLIKDSERYKTLEECTSSSADTEEIVESTNQDHTIASKRYDDFVNATDRILFMIYLIFYTTIIFKYIV